MNSLISNVGFRASFLGLLYGLPLLLGLMARYDISIPKLLQGVIIMWAYSLLLHMVVGIGLMLYGKFAKRNHQRDAYFTLGLWLIILPLVISITLAAFNS